MASSSSAASKVCFNSTCTQALIVPRKGWLCRTGDFADLCDRCASAFEEGKFCDTYHLNASGWRSCESCGKQVHCGCIVSFHMFILLDAGGIECLKCAKTEYILTPNPTWPSGRINGISSKSLRPGPVPWRQAPSLFNAFKGQQLTERFVNDSRQEMIWDKAVTGMFKDGKHNLFKDVSYQSYFHTNNLYDQKIDTTNVSGIHVKRLCTPPSVGKECSNNNGPGPSLRNQAQDETQSCHQLLPRYWSRLPDQELQQLPGCSNTKITPLFEKVLSASDVGKIGRLVLPKKYAEVHLPPITVPEGYPLVIQDIKGKEWVLQYRFWSNNNSRMYVLEGVTPCIQSMQLQAGDTVTFSRLPEGKLVMGFRKTSLASPSDKGNETTNTRISAHEKDGTWSGVDKISVRAKRKKGVKMLSNSKNLRLSISLEHVQGLLQPPLNAPTIVLIEGVEFEVFQEAPSIGNPRAFSTDNVGSLCSTEVEPTPKHLDHNNHENPESLNTKEELDALADLAVHDGKATRSHPCILQHGTNHKSTCMCNTCLAVNHPTPAPMMHHDLSHPTQMLYAGQSFEQSCKSTLKSQNIDLNIQPEREEDTDSIGIMRLVQESTQRYMKQQTLSIKNDDL